MARCTFLDNGFEPCRTTARANIPAVNSGISEKSIWSSFSARTRFQSVRDFLKALNFLIASEFYSMDSLDSIDTVRLSFPRRRESSLSWHFQSISGWIPTFAGMTLPESALISLVTHLPVSLELTFENTSASGLQYRRTLAEAVRDAGQD